MRYRLVLFVALLAAGIAACQPATGTPAPTSAPTPTATTAPVVAALPPALEPATEALQACAQAQRVPLALITVPQSQAAPPVVNLRLWWGENPPAGWRAYAVAEEQLVAITARTPAPALTADDVRRIVIGQRTTWETDAATPIPLALWLPVPDTAAFQRLAAWLGHAPLRSDAALAPNPKAMLTAIAGDGAALGFVPRGWLHTLPDDSPVHPVPLDAPPAAWQAPVLVLLPAHAPPEAEALAGCLQQGRGQVILQGIYAP